MRVRVYLFKGKLLFPTVVATPAYHLETEPVEVLHLPEATPERIVAVLEVLRSRGNPEIPLPSPKNLPKPVVLRPAGARSWREFERGARTWTIRIEGDTMELIPQRRRPDRGWETWSERTERFEGEGAALALARRLLEQIEEGEQPGPA